MCKSMEDMGNEAAENTLLQTIKNLMETMKHCMWVIRGMDMEVVRKYIDADRLMAVMELPETFRNRRLEVIVLPTEETAGTGKTALDIEKAIKALTGAVPYTGMSLSERGKAAEV